MYLLLLSYCGEEVRLLRGYIINSCAVNVMMAEALERQPSPPPAPNKKPHLVPEKTYKDNFLSVNQFTFSLQSSVIKHHIL